MTPDQLNFEADLAAERATDEPALVVDVEGFEGPLDLLLAILALADQYLAFIEEARKLRLELAADYLVMAAWLAYLKSRLLLPDTHAPEGQSAEQMAAALALRLKRLEAIRYVAERLFARPQLDRDVFNRGKPEPTPCARPGALCQAHRLVAGRGARGDRAPDRPVVGLGAPRRVPDRVCGGAVAGAHRIRLELRLHARNGA